MRISLCKDGYRHTTTGKDATKDVKKEKHLAKKYGDKERGSSRIRGWGEEK